MVNVGLVMLTLPQQHPRLRRDNSILQVGIGTADEIGSLPFTYSDATWKDSRCQSCLQACGGLPEFLTLNSQNGYLPVSAVELDRQQDVGGNECDYKKYDKAFLSHWDSLKVCFAHQIGTRQVGMITDAKLEQSGMTMTSGKSRVRGPTAVTASPLHRCLAITSSK